MLVVACVRNDGVGVPRPDADAADRAGRQEGPEGFGLDLAVEVEGEGGDEEIESRAACLAFDQVRCKSDFLRFWQASVDADVVLPVSTTS